MREYSTPAVVEVPASARLTDTVFERAEHDPGLVVLRRKASLAPSGLNTTLSIEPRSTVSLPGTFLPLTTRKERGWKLVPPVTATTTRSPTGGM